MKENKDFGKKIIGDLMGKIKEKTDKRNQSVEDILDCLGKREWDEALSKISNLIMWLYAEGTRPNEGERRLIRIIQGKMLLINKEKKIKEVDMLRYDGWLAFAEGNINEAVTLSARLQNIIKEQNREPNKREQALIESVKEATKIEAKEQKS